MFFFSSFTRHNRTQHHQKKKKIPNTWGMVNGHEPNKRKQQLKESKDGAEIGTHITNYESMIFAIQKFKMKSHF